MQMQVDVLNKQPTILYVYFGEFSNIYFENELELKEYYEKSRDPFASTGVIEYFSDSVSYYEYGPDKINENIFLWQLADGSIEWMYKAFKDKGVVFKNDIYAKVREEEQQFINILKQVLK